MLSFTEGDQESFLKSHFSHMEILRKHRCSLRKKTTNTSPPIFNHYSCCIQFIYKCIYVVVYICLFLHIHIEIPFLIRMERIHLFNSFHSKQETFTCVRNESNKTQFTAAWKKLQNRTDGNNFGKHFQSRQPHQQACMPQEELQGRY